MTTTARKVAGTFAAGLGAQVLALLALLLSVRLLGNDGNGQLVFAYYLAATTLGIAVLGQRSGSIFFVARGEVPAHTALSNSTVYAAVTGGSCAGVLLALSWWFPGGPWHVLPTPVIWAIATALPLLVLRELAIAVARAQGRFGFFNFQRLYLECSRLLAVGILAGVLALGVSEVATTLYVAEAAVALLITVLVWKPLTKAFTPSWSAFAKVQRYSARAALIVLANVLHRNLDKFLIPALLVDGTVLLTQYHLALVCLAPVNLLAGVVSTVIFPTLAKVSDQDKIWSAHRFVRIFLMAGVLMSLGVATVGPWIIPLLFGESNRPAYDLLLILIPGILALVITTNITSYLSARREFRFWIFVGYGLVAANVVLNLLLIPRMGVHGVALATTLTYVAEAAVLGAYFVRRTGSHMRSLLFMRQGDIALIRGNLKGRGSSPVGS